MNHYLIVLTVGAGSFVLGGVFTLLILRWRVMPGVIADNVDAFLTAAAAVKPTREYTPQQLLDYRRAHQS